MQGAHGYVQKRQTHTEKKYDLIRYHYQMKKNNPKTNGGLN